MSNEAFQAWAEKLCDLLAKSAPKPCLGWELAKVPLGDGFAQVEWSLNEPPEVDEDEDPAHYHPDNIGFYRVWIGYWVDCERFDNFQRKLWQHDVSEAQIISRINALEAA